MEEFQLLRNNPTDEGTTGFLWHKDFNLFTMEPPWRDNHKNISCIPTGDYILTPYYSSRFGNCFAVLNVPDRTNIRIHCGNWAGDTSMGYKSDSSGCILIGETITELSGQLAVSSSRSAMKILQKQITEPVKLKIMYQVEV